MPDDDRRQRRENVSGACQAVHRYAHGWDNHFGNCALGRAGRAYRAGAGPRGRRRWQCLSRPGRLALLAGRDAGPGGETGHRQGEHPPGYEDLGGQRKRDRDPLHYAVARPGNPGREDRQGHGAGPTGKLWRSSNFNRNVLKPAYQAVGWRDANGNSRWTWHSLRHVFCTTALFTWKLEATDVSCMAGHANVRTTLLMYVGTTAGVLDRARKATD
jgi:hypothetical protein